MKASSRQGKVAVEVVRDQIIIRNGAAAATSSYFVPIAALMLCVTYMIGR